MIRNYPTLLKGGSLAAAMIVLTAGSALADYPAASYQLSDDGKTLEAWKGTETVIDMNSDAALAAVTAIGNNAFRGLDITDITVGDKVASVGKWAFFGCAKLTKADLPAALTLLDNAAFSGCSALETIAIPAGVSEINNSVFYDCTALKSVTLGSGVTAIGSGSFANCSALTAMTLPENMTTIGEEAFSACSALTEIAIPAKVTTIGAGAFEECAALKSVTFGAGITDIESSAFTESGITSLDLTPIAGPVSFGTNVFASCPDLTEVKLPAKVDYVGSGLLQNCKALTALTIPDTWEEIPTKLCYGCSALNTLDMGTGVESIRNGAFFECSLGQLTWSPAITSIDWNVLYGCTGITDLVLPAGLKTVDDYTFSSLPELRTVHIGADAESFGTECFSTCPKLEKVVCEAVTPPTLGNYAFYKSNVENATLEVPAGSIDAYKGADQWKDFMTVSDINTGIGSVSVSAAGYTVVTLDGKVLLRGAESLDTLPAGLYIINGRASMKK